MRAIEGGSAGAAAGGAVSWRRRLGRGALSGQSLALRRRPRRPAVHSGRRASPVPLPARHAADAAERLHGGDDWKLTSDKTGDPAIDGSAAGALRRHRRQRRSGLADDHRPARRAASPCSTPASAGPSRSPTWSTSSTSIAASCRCREGSTNAARPVRPQRRRRLQHRRLLADGTHAPDSRVSDQNGNGVDRSRGPDLPLLRRRRRRRATATSTTSAAGTSSRTTTIALDEVRYGHGTGESHDSSAEANNGIGDVGTCPNCLLLEVRVGDSFVTEVNHFAQGVVFAVDSGARVVQEALGTLNHIALRPAGDRLRLPQAASSSSPRPPTRNRTTTTIRRTTTTPCEVNSVTKFADVSGLDAVAALVSLSERLHELRRAHRARRCRRRAARRKRPARSAGMAGLVVSAALNAIDRGMLTPYPRDDGSAGAVPAVGRGGEADPHPDRRRHQLRRARRRQPAAAAELHDHDRRARHRSTASASTRSPASISTSATAASTPTRAVLRVAAGQIPPEASIDVAGVVRHRRSATRATLDDHAAASPPTAPPRTRYVLEVAPGVQPAEGDFVVQASGERAHRGARRRRSATIDLGALAARMPHGVDGPADRRRRPARSRSLHLHRPRARRSTTRATSARIAAPSRCITTPTCCPASRCRSAATAPRRRVTADLDGDGREEIILGTSDGAVHAFRADGSELPGWPVHTDPLEVARRRAGYAQRRDRHARPQLDPRRRRRSATSIATARSRSSPPTCRAGSTSGNATARGAPASRSRRCPSTRSRSAPSATSARRTAGCPTAPTATTRDNRLGRALLGGAALGNLDGSADGSLEIVAGAFDRHLYAWHADGTPVPGWPVLLKDPGQGRRRSIPITNEVTLAADAERGASAPRSSCRRRSATSTATARSTSSRRSTRSTSSRPTRCSRTPSSGSCRPPACSTAATRASTPCYADGAAHGDSGIERGWNPDAFLPGWPVKTALLTTELLPTVGSGSNGPPALADVDGDGTLEIGTMSAIGPAYVFTRRRRLVLRPAIRPARTARSRPRPSAPAATRPTRRPSAALGAVGAGRVRRRAARASSCSRRPPGSAS